MPSTNEQDKEIMEKLSGKTLTEPEILDAKLNLFGFFKVLYKIDQRLKREAQEKAAGKGGGNG